MPLWMPLIRLQKNKLKNKSSKDNAVTNLNQLAIDVRLILSLVVKKIFTTLVKFWQKKRTTDAAWFPALKTALAEGLVL